MDWLFCLMNRNPQGNPSYSLYSKYICMRNTLYTPCVNVVNVKAMIFRDFL